MVTLLAPAQAAQRAPAGAVAILVLRPIPSLDFSLEPPLRMLSLDTNLMSLYALTIEPYVVAIGGSTTLRCAACEALRALWLLTWHHMCTRALVLPMAEGGRSGGGGVLPSPTPGDDDSSGTGGSSGRHPFFAGIDTDIMVIVFAAPEAAALAPSAAG
ncbi:hypothetical protein JKP88DRAFT_280490 [Tribonema minus]|uniref:Uncharacterized protein n=1 Tax=Tribonema minus TaxID=303371 RepID=A0A836CB93_9STRA|nr:hypothetical protein JKP88DRAFT_280490 [Tribonema minus]